jgi:hypothetical protein
MQTGFQLIREELQTNTAWPILRQRSGMGYTGQPRMWWQSDQTVRYYAPGLQRPSAAYPSFSTGSLVSGHSGSNPIDLI